VTV
jgi:hypothetical protein